VNEFLLHSLWQPLAIAAAAAALLRLASRLGPAAKANLWLLAILLAAVVPAVTAFLPPPAVIHGAAFTIPVNGAASRATGGLALWPLAVGVLALARAVWLGAGLWRIRELRTGRSVLITDRVAVPATFGFLRPVVALPRREWRADVRRAVLEHERQHIRRNDYAWNLAVEWATLAIWWHPAVWWMKRGWAAERGSPAMPRPPRDFRRMAACCSTRHAR
jgi:D-alanyl-D-alanine endopeptidase (penicillin-binding protein 7)